MMTTKKVSRQARAADIIDYLSEELGLDTAAFADEAARLADEGKTPLYAAVDGRLAAVLAVSDPIRDTTPAAIAAHRATCSPRAHRGGQGARRALCAAGAESGQACPRIHASGAHARRDGRPHAAGFHR